MDTVQLDLPSLVGSWRRFGPVGAVYEVIGTCGMDPDGETLMRIRVLGSGEEADYRLSELLDDPEES